MDSDTWGGRFDIEGPNEDKKNGVLGNGLNFGTMLV